MMPIDGPLPAAVRAGTQADRDAYRAAQGFEQLLLGELVQAMVPKGALTEGPYAAPVQDALAGGLVSAGGIGLAAQLYPQLRSQPLSNRTEPLAPRSNPAEPLVPRSEAS
jgi:Rod binding domain-containing protein